MTYKALKDSGNYKGIESTQYLTSKTFYPSDNIQEWTVPEGVTQVHVDCVASKGKESGNVTGGNGGRVQCDLTVIPNQKYYIVVGRTPTSNSTPTYNASDIRTDNTGITDSTSLASRLIVAGGGGCAGINYDYIYSGGDGGNTSGGNADSSTYVIGGTGGTQSSGGTKGVPSGGTNLRLDGSNGYFGLGGYNNDNTVAIGGAGWYGGGSGCGVSKVVFVSELYYASGGGGGSSYTDSSLCSDITHTQGYNDGEGYITISAINAGDYVATRKGYKLIKE